MDKRYIKKLERVLGSNGICVNGYIFENEIVLAMQKQAEANDYDFSGTTEFDETDVEVKFEFKDGSIVEVEGNIDRTMKYYPGPNEELPYNRTNINAIYVTDHQGNKINCNFEYSYD
ncbi:hypothetical protein [Clostridium tagluense]|uniref:hypothetical protein n=1 Tax=Clostridium tagluense TaxID=360422 RepID=UPI001CF1EA20|nr:hypothetical protein [Clostridium tagluense]MCB2301099.1 hypothetical protein [Clostridium tagluense]